MPLGERFIFRAAPLLRFWCSVLTQALMMMKMMIKIAPIMSAFFVFGGKPMMNLWLSEGIALVIEMIGSSLKGLVLATPLLSRLPCKHICRLAIPFWKQDNDIGLRCKFRHRPIRPMSFCSDIEYCYMVKIGRIDVSNANLCMEMGWGCGSRNCPF